MRISNPSSIPAAYVAVNSEAPGGPLYRHNGNVDFDGAETFCTVDNGGGIRQPRAVRALELRQDMRFQTVGGSVLGRRGDFVAQSLDATNPHNVLVFKKEHFAATYAPLSERLPEAAKSLGELRLSGVDGRSELVTLYSARQQGYAAAEDFIRMATLPRVGHAPGEACPTLVIDLADAPSTLKERNHPLKMSSGDTGRVTVNAAGRPSPGAADYQEPDIFKADVRVECTSQRGGRVTRTVDFARPPHGLKDAKTLDALVRVIEDKLGANKANAPVRLVLRDNEGLPGVALAAALELREKWATRALGDTQESRDQQMQEAWSRHCGNCYGFTMEIPSAHRVLLSDYARMLAQPPRTETPQPAAVETPQSVPPSNAKSIRPDVPRGALVRQSKVPEGDARPPNPPASLMPTTVLGPPFVTSMQAREQDLPRPRASKHAPMPSVRVTPMSNVLGPAFVTSLYVAKHTPPQATVAQQVQKAAQTPLAVRPHVSKIQVEETPPPGTRVTSISVLDTEPRKR